MLACTRPLGRDAWSRAVAAREPAHALVDHPLEPVAPGVAFAAIARPVTAAAGIAFDQRQQEEEDDENGESHYRQGQSEANECRYDDLAAD